MRSQVLVPLVLACSLVGATDTAAQRDEVRRARPSERGWLGFAWTPATIRLNGETRPAAVVQEIVEGSPADRAGLEPGDTVIAINGLRVTERFMDTLAETLAPGDEVRVRLRRDGSEREYTMTADRRPSEYAVAPRGRLRIEEIPPDSIRRRMRIYLDTLRAMRVPPLRVERLPGGEVRLYRGDSVAFRFHPDSSWFRGGRGIWIAPDSLYLRFNPDWGRGWSFQVDSLFQLHMDTLRLERGHIYGWTPDSVFRLEPGLPLRYSITMFGGRAIGGAELIEVNPALGEYFGTDSGLLVTRVGRDTPAERAGLEAGDVIVAINGEDVESMSDLRRAVTRASHGERIRLEVLRKRERRTIELRND